MFLERAEIGYVCWNCGKDTLKFVSDTMFELCHDCDQSYRADYGRQAEDLIRNNQFFVDDSVLETTPVLSLKIKFRGFRGFVEFLEWMNANVGKDRWNLPTNPMKEMKNNNGCSTFHIHLFEKIDIIKMDWPGKSHCAVPMSVGPINQMVDLHEKTGKPNPPSKAARAKMWQELNRINEKELRESLSEQGLL